MTFRIASTFNARLAKLTGDEQKAAKTTGACGIEAEGQAYGVPTSKHFRGYAVPPGPLRRLPMPFGSTPGSIRCDLYLDASSFDLVNVIMQVIEAIGTIIPKPDLPFGQYEKKNQCPANTDRRRF